MVFGQRKPVALFATLVSLADPSSLSLKAPNYSGTNGLQLWLLSGDQLKTLRERCERTPGAKVISRPRISTGDGVPCGLNFGTTVLLGGSSCWAGLNFDCCARVRSDSTDLLTTIRFSELATNQVDSGEPAARIVIQTNWNTTVRVQIPKGSGLFLFDGSPGNAARKHMGLILDPP